MKPILWLVACALMTVLLGGCAARKPLVTGNGSYRADTVYVAKAARDTFVVRDSVAVDVFRDGDTVYRTKEVWRWRERASVRVDTVYKNAVRADTIRVAVPQERRLTWWERTVERPLDKAVELLAAVGLAWIVMWIVRRKIAGRTHDER